MAVLSSEETVTSGGRSSGRERKLWYSFGAGAGAELVLLPVPTAALCEPGSSRTATVKLHANGIVVLPSRSSAWTVTSSPSANGCEGRKLAPSPWE